MRTTFKDGGTSLMARPKKPEKNSPVRLTEEAIKWARIASGYTGESMSEYVTRITIERGKEDAERLHTELMQKGKPSRPKGDS